MTNIVAIRISSTGGPSVMEIAKVPLPEPGPDEIRVRHEAIGVNFIDTYHRSGLYPVPLPSGIGLEAAGIVDAIGSAVSTIAPGDRVAYCSGPVGAYAEMHVIKAERAVHIPDGVAFETVAASLLKGLTVQYLIRQIHACGPDDAVLFHAGAGGVGQIALQWLKALGTSVIATAGGAQKCRICSELGADKVIDYHTEDVADRVREFTNGKGVRVVFDGVGKDTWLSSLDSLQPRGLMVSFGNASGPVTGVDLGILASKGSLFVTRPTLIHYTSTRETLQAAADDYFAALQSGSIKITEPIKYQLSDAIEAHENLEARITTGSLILKS